MTPELMELRRRALDGMVAYRKLGGAESEADPDFDPEFNPGYTQEDVDQCGVILDEFVESLAALAVPKRNAAVRKAVKSAVLKLNRLNDRCEGCLIETDQREALCAFLTAATRSVGYELAEHGDVTEDWREWRPYTPNQPSPRPDREVCHRDHGVRLYSG